MCVELCRWLGAVKTANRELRSVSHDEENPVNWAREEVGLVASGMVRVYIYDSMDND